MAVRCVRPESARTEPPQVGLGRRAKALLPDFRDQMPLDRRLICKSHGTLEAPVDNGAADPQVHWFRHFVFTTMVRRVLVDNSIASPQEERDPLSLRVLFSRGRQP